MAEELSISERQAAADFGKRHSLAGLEPLRKKPVQALRPVGRVVDARQLAATGSILARLAELEAAAREFAVTNPADVSERLDAVEARLARLEEVLG